MLRMSKVDREIADEMGEWIEPLNPARTIDLVMNYRQGVFVKSRALYPAMLGAKGSSKTWALILRCLFLMIDSPFHGNMVGNRGFIARKEWQSFKNTVLREIFRIFPRELIKRYIKSDRILLLNNGSELICGHFDDLAPVMGINLGFAALSQIEQAPLETWKEFQTSRVRLTVGLTGNPILYRSCFGEGNPPGPSHWTYLWMLNQKRCHEPDFDPRYELIQSAAIDNKRFLPPDYFENARRNLSPRQYRRDIEGSFEGLEGAVWEEYDETRHVTEEGKPEVVPEPHWPKAITLDYGRRAGHATNFLALNTDVWPPRLIQFDDIFIENALIVDHVKVIEEKLNQHRADRLERLNVTTSLDAYVKEFHFARFDPAMKRLADTPSVRTGNTQVTVIELYREELAAKGIHFGWLPADNDIDAGVERVAFLLRTDRFVINRHCRDTREQIQSWILDPKTGKPADGQKDHCCDGLRYGATAFPVQIVMPAEPHKETVAERIMRLAAEDDVRHNFAEVY